MMMRRGSEQSDSPVWHAESCGWISLWMLVVAATGLACSPSGDEQTTRAERGEGRELRLEVVAVHEPLRYMAERIGESFVAVTLPVPPGEDPAHWAPTAEQVIAFQTADLILLNGAGYEPWLKSVTLPRASRLDTTAALSAQLIERSDVTTHAHGPAGSHSHARLAFTTWLDPELAIGQARAVAEGLARARPDGAARYRERLGALEGDLRELDRRLTAIAMLLNGAPVLFSHPVYQYLERRYELNGRTVEWEPNELPSQVEWERLASILEDHSAELMIWEAQPEPEIVARLADLGIRVVVFSPGANRSGQRDWLDRMFENASALERVSHTMHGGESLPPSAN
jgi:zinc transport system substrate-binding protein